MNKRVIQVGKELERRLRIKSRGGGKGEATGGILGVKITPTQCRRKLCKSFLIFDLKTKKDH